MSDSCAVVAIAVALAIVLIVTAGRRHKHGRARFGASANGESNYAFVMLPSPGGVVITNTTAVVSLFGNRARPNIPANSFPPGSIMRIRAGITILKNAPGVIYAFKLNMNGQELVGYGNWSGTSGQLQFDISVTLGGGGFAVIDDLILASGGKTPVLTSVSTNWDSTVANAVDFTVQCNMASTANMIQMDTFSIS